MVVIKDNTKKDKDKITSTLIIIRMVIITIVIKHNMEKGEKKRKKTKKTKKKKKTKR